MNKTLEGAELLREPPKRQGTLLAPVVQLDDGMLLDDRVFRSPTAILGNTDSGKSTFLEKIMQPVLQTVDAVRDNAVIFCAKRDLLDRFYRTGDIVISARTAQPSGCWNIFRELDAAQDAELVARDIAKALTKSQHSSLTPFFENAANDVLFSVIMQMYEKMRATGQQYGNWHLVDFFNRVSIRRDAPLNWYDLAALYPERFAHILDYLGDESAQGFGVLSEITTLLHEAFWGSFAAADGQFSAIRTLKTGGRRIFLYYDLANSSEASVKIYQTVLELLFKHSLDPDNRRRTWYFLDEFSLLPKTCLADVLSLGRGMGTRVFICLQSAALLTRHYTEQEAKTLLSLFPNLLCFRVMDSLSRAALADRYGKGLRQYTVADCTQAKPLLHIADRAALADGDFCTLLEKKGNALCSIPELSGRPFLYSGYKKELDV